MHVLRTVEHLGRAKFKTQCFIFLLPNVGFVDLPCEEVLNNSHLPRARLENVEVVCGRSGEGRHVLGRGNLEKTCKTCSARRARRAGSKEQQRSFGGH